MTDRQATIAECIAVAEATREGREVTARDVWVAYALVAGEPRDPDELRDWREWVS